MGLNLISKTIVFSGLKEFIKNKAMSNCFMNYLLIPGNAGTRLINRIGDPRWKPKKDICPGVHQILGFSLKCNFSELCQFCCSAGVLPAWCVYTHWHREKTESGKYIKIFEKPQYLINTLYVNIFDCPIRNLKAVSLSAPIVPRSTLDKKNPTQFSLSLLW